MKKWYRYVGPGLMVILVLMITTGVVLRFMEQGNHYPTFKNFGIYDGCHPEDCLNRLDNIAQQGVFKDFLDYTALMGNSVQIRDFAGRAQQDRIKIIWPFKDAFSMTDTEFQNAYAQLLSECRCQDRLTFVRYVVGLVSNLPATTAYYIADEPTADNYQAVAAIANTIGSADKTHPRIVVLSGATGQSYLQLYGSAPFVDMIGLDYYPLGRSADPQSDIEKTADVAKDLQRVADQYHKQSLFVLQAHSFSQIAAYAQLCTRTKTCVAPSEQQLEREANLAISNSKVSLVMWYSYYYVMHIPGQLQRLVTACKQFT